MKADRHAASGQGRNGITVENSRGREIRCKIIHPPPQIRIGLARKHQFSRPDLG
jgi:hypothetical protein